MSGKTISTSETKVEALKLQSSAYGVTIPMVWGVTRISGNMLWYGGFKAVPHTTTQGGKGGGVRMQNTTFTYLASVMMGLCQGPIAGIPRIWRGKKLYSGGVTPSQVLTATEGYTPPGSGAMTYTLAHGGTYVGMVAVTGTTGWGVDLYSYNLAQGTDYTVSGGVLTILAESQRGIALSVQYQYTSGAIVNTALAGLGLSFKAGAVGQAVWSALSAFPTQKLGYSGLAYVAGQDYDLGTGAQVENHMFEVVGSMAYHLGSSVPDVDPSVMLRSLLTHAQGGAGMPPQLLDAWAAWSDYCVAAGLLVSPAITEQVAAAEVVRLAGKLTNTGPVWSGGRLKMVPYADSAESGNGRTFTPNTTPVYELDDTCYTPRNGDDPPVTVRLKSPAARFNHLKVEFLNRGNQYNIEIAEAKDQADIDANGLRTDPTTVVAHWICEPAVARRVAQTLLQRSLFVGNEYVAPLPWHYALLEPMDLITLADARLEMAALPARIIVIEEAEDGDLTITAEDYPPGTASAALYPSQAGAGYTHDYNADPGSVQTPVIFEAPGPLSATGLEICVAVTGLGAAWGGCHVHASTDGSNYRQIGTVYGGSRYGKLGAAISGGNLPVVLESGQLASGSAGDAAALNTLCYIGGSAPEYCAYQTATLTSALHYTLSGLVRGAYRSNAASAHAVNDAFVRVDDAVARSGTLDVGRIGDTVYVKCTSFNIYGGGEQDLSAATAYTHVITGAMFGAEKTFRVAAHGYSDTGHVVSSGLYNGLTGASAFGATVARSYHLARVRRSDGVVTFSRQYDVYGAGAIGGFDAADLAADLDATGTDSLVVVFTYDDPLQNRLTGGLPSAMYRCGASRAVFGSPLFRSRGAYILIGIAGCGEGQGYESYQGAVPADTNAWVDVGFLLRNGNLIVSGTGATPRTLADYSYTGNLEATKNTLYQDSFDFAGAAFGTAIARSFTFTPSLSAVMKFSATLVAKQVYGDAGHYVWWTVQPAGGSEITIGNCESWDTSKRSYVALTSFAAAAGVALTFRIRTQRPAFDPNIQLYESEMRVESIE